MNDSIKIELDIDLPDMYKCYQQDIKHREDKITYTEIIEKYDICLCHLRALYNYMLAYERAWDEEVKNKEYIDFVHAGLEIDKDNFIKDRGGTK